jgi:hypothetical protein
MEMPFSVALPGNAAGHFHFEFEKSAMQTRSGSRLTSGVVVRVLANSATEMFPSVAFQGSASLSLVIVFSRLSPWAIDQRQGEATAENCRRIVSRITHTQSHFAALTR